MLICIISGSVGIPFPPPPLQTDTGCSFPALDHQQTKQWVHPVLSSDRYFLQFCAPWNISHLCGIHLLTDQWSEFFHTQYLAACSLSIQESWKISKVVCQSSLLSLARKKRLVEMLGFFKTVWKWEQLFGLTTNFLSKKGVWFVCLTQQLSLQLHPRAPNSVVNHAWIGKKPKKMIVILDTRSGLLGLYNGKKKGKKSLVLWKLHSCHQKC